MLENPETCEEPGMLGKPETCEESRMLEKLGKINKTNYTMDTLKERLKHECDMMPSDEVLGSFISIGRERHYAEEETVIGVGEVNPSVYIVKEGLLRMVDMNGGRERVVAFGLEGTVYASKHSFVKLQPSYYEVIACCETVLIEIRHDRMYEWLNSNHEGAIWFLRLMLEELYFLEYNNATVHNGTGIERFRSLIKTRPEIIGRVRQKHIASYLGISPEYLCRIRQKMRKNPD